MIGFEIKLFKTIPDPEPEYILKLILIAILIEPTAVLTGTWIKPVASSNVIPFVRGSKFILSTNSNL